jgi:hypothetical protein
VPYHESFWVAAAAAPITVLANQVAISTSMGLFSSFRVTLRAGNLPGGDRTRAKLGSYFAAASYFLAFLNVVIQAFALTGALQSFMHRYDYVSMPQTTAIQVAGLGVVALTAVFLAVSGTVLVRLEGSGSV